jgi:catechol 2,3-dioxygenase-like lactoylglutathione lyase family enzyme
MLQHFVAEENERTQIPVFPYFRTKPGGRCGLDAVGGPASMPIENVACCLQARGDRHCRGDPGATILAFVEDPDGYKIELLGKKRVD